MEFNFKSDFSAKPMSKAQIISVAGNFWQKIYKFVFLLVLLVLIGLGAYVWRKSLSGGQWSVEKKQEYINSQSSGVVFKEDDFKKATEDVEMRKKENAGEQEPIKDIFKSY